MLCRLLLFVLCPPRRDEEGQSTVEYALVMLAAAALAMAALHYIGHNNVLGKLFDAVFNGLIAHAKSK